MDKVVELHMDKVVGLNQMSLEAGCKIVRELEKTQTVWAAIQLP